MKRQMDFLLWNDGMYGKRVKELGIHLGKTFI